MATARQLQPGTAVTIRERGLYDGLFGIVQTGTDPGGPGRGDIVSYRVRVHMPDESWYTRTFPGRALRALPGGSMRRKRPAGHLRTKPRH